MASRYTQDIQEQALALVSSGNTYSSIQTLLGVPKSTLSTWVKNKGSIRDRSKQLAHLKNARIRAAEVKRSLKLARFVVAKEDAEKIAGLLDIEDTTIQKTILAMLYWAEGGKQDGNLKFTNTDPLLLELFIKLFRVAYTPDETRFRVELQVHEYHNKDEAIAFWSTRLNIPDSQFFKIYVKKRSEGGKRFRENFMGICHIHYSSSAVQRELLQLGNATALNTLNRLSSFNG